jgi:hypothetical protein
MHGGDRAPAGILKPRVGETRKSPGRPEGPLSIAFWSLVAQRARAACGPAAGLYTRATELWGGCRPRSCRPGPHGSVPRKPARTLSAPLGGTIARQPAAPCRWERPGQVRWWRTGPRRQVQPMRPANTRAPRLIGGPPTARRGQGRAPGESAPSPGCRQGIRASSCRPPTIRSGRGACGPWTRPQGKSGWRCRRSPAGLSIEPGRLCSLRPRCAGTKLRRGVHAAADRPHRQCLCQRPEESGKKARPTAVPRRARSVAGLSRGWVGRQRV